MHKSTFYVIPSSMTKPPLTLIFPEKLGCECDYYSGGCVIVEGAGYGSKCRCTYDFINTCSGTEESCSSGEISAGSCVRGCTSQACCVTGGGDCGGY